MSRLRAVSLVLGVVAAAAAPAAVAVAAPGMAAGGHFLPPEQGAWWLRVQSAAGIPVLVALAWALGRHRRAVRWRPVLWGVGLQLALAVVVLSPAATAFFFNVVDAFVHRLLSFAEAGIDFVFQTVQPHFVSTPDPATGEPVRQLVEGHTSPPLKSVAFWVLPTIVFFSSLMTWLYHIGVMQWVVKGFAWLMYRTLGTSGAETLSAAANVVVGQTEAPLLVKPFVESMTLSELNAVMVGGFATVAGGVMAVYVLFLRDIPGIAGHLVTASILSAPAALAVAKVMVPEMGEPVTARSLRMHVERPDVNSIEAIARGATDGMRLYLNVLAMLIAFVAMVALADWVLGVVGLSLSQVLGWLFAPIAFVMGIPWSQCGAVGRLLGEKLVLTELLAYSHLGEMIRHGPPVLSERSAIIASYALCGFANFASIGIQIGGIGGIGGGGGGGGGGVGVGGGGGGGGV